MVRLSYHKKTIVRLSYHKETIVRLSYHKKKHRKSISSEEEVGQEVNGGKCEYRTSQYKYSWWNIWKRSIFRYFEWG